MSTSAPVQPPPPAQSTHPTGVDAPTPQQPAPSGRSAGRAGRIVLGVALVLVGIVWSLDLGGVLELRAEVVLPAALVLVGVALLALAGDPAGHGGLVALGVLLGLAALLVSAPWRVADVPLSAGLGERVERPRVLSDLEDLDLTAGSLHLDLTELDVGRGGGQPPQVLEASVGMGELVVRVPHDAQVRVHARVGLGEARILGIEEGGVDVDVETQTAGFAGGHHRLDLRLRVDVGQVEVRT